MDWKLCDLHTHTDMSDATYGIDTLVEVETNLGQTVGVSDHMFCCGMYTVRQVYAYLETLKRYPVYRGYEMNMEHNIVLPEDAEMAFDYVIAAVHSLPDCHGGFIPLSAYFHQRAGYTAQYEKNYAPDLCRQYLAHVIRLMEKAFGTQRVDILGHADVLPPCSELYGTKFLTDWENAVISLCKRYGIALEISGMWRAPDMDMLRRAKEAGLRFSVGSDCHRVAEIGVLDYPKLAIETLGIEQDDLFRPSRAL